MTVSNYDVLKAFLEIVLGDGTIAQNVYYFFCSFVEDQENTDVGDAVQSYIEDIMGAVATYLSDDFTINPSYLHRIGWDVTGAKWAVEELIDIFTPSFTHTNTDDPFPNQIAPVLVANTDTPKSRGRKFLPGFVETAAEGSSLVSAAVTALGTALAHYIADETISTNNTLLVGVPSSNSGNFRFFTDGVVNSIVGTQRRRKPGVGT